MSDLDATTLKTLSTYLQWQSLIVAVVLGALLGRALRPLVILALDRDSRRSVLPVVGRLWVTVAYGSLVALYALLVAPMVQWGGPAMLWAGAAALSMLVFAVGLRLLYGYVPRPSLTGVLLRIILLLVLLLLALLSLMRAGFVNLTTDRPVLRVELTGATRPQTVRWAAPDQPMQEVALRTHQIRLRLPSLPGSATEGGAGEVIAEEWLYGDQVAIKGRVLRLDPMLNTVGIANLFELQFLHNGYFTAERHSSQPHLARALRPIGTMAVSPSLAPLRNRALAWLLGRPDGSHLAIRTVSSESTYFPLVDGKGEPLQRSFDLVLTPGGLTAK